MSDTPKTDATAHNMGSLEQPHYIVDVEIAQDLERRLIAAEAENAALRKLLREFLRGALNVQKALVKMLRESPLQGREYIDLGIQLNASIDNIDAARKE